LSRPLITTLVVAAPMPLAPASATARPATNAGIKRFLITLSSLRTLGRGRIRRFLRLERSAAPAAI
jgi:hypothetical protein